jgi:hypothetical protein
VPIIRIVRSQTVDRQTYETVSTAIDLEHQHPLGLLMHAAGEVDGRWQIVNVWEAKEYADRFDQEVLEPAIRELTGEDHKGREIKTYEVEHLVTP